MKDLTKNLRDWSPPEHWHKITTIDAHTEGEPLRVITGGYPDLPGDTILDRRRYAKEDFDYLRTALMWEPRGHADMYGCVIVPPVTDRADFGVLFLHNEGYSTMCGHGIIAVTKVAVECGLLPMLSPETTVRIDTPAGLVTSFAHVRNGKVVDVRFHNVASFVDTLDAIVEVPEVGLVKYDLAFGGAYYAFVDAASVDLECVPEQCGDLITKGKQIKRAIMETATINHPIDPDLSFLYGVIFIGPPVDADADSRNVCVFAEGEVDRSPTGTGISARMALHYARHEIEIGEPMVIESILGTRFTASVVSETQLGPYPAIIPEVKGRAFITGRQEFLIDPDDPLQRGFILR